ncbi:MAG TPA: hypothetical protein VKR58_03220 [Aquella sp.]|nr:hypothetical protein [Aquella sp.]
MNSIIENHPGVYFTEQTMLSIGNAINYFQNNPFPLRFLKMILKSTSALFERRTIELVIILSYWVAWVKIILLTT